MQLTLQKRKDITLLYCIIFYVLMIYKWWNGLFLYQLKPYLFNNRLDMLTWIFMKTGLHQWLLQNPTGCVLLDCLFYLMPLLTYLSLLVSVRLSSFTAGVMLVITWLYVQCYTLYPANSIESFIGWLLFPLLFITVNLKNFYFVLQSLRYFFLFFFVSAAVWKVVQGGFFNINQMSGVLLYQQKEYLTSSNNWYTSVIYWLINHPFVSYLFYLLGFLLELSFITGFFTKKLDRVLLALAILFFICDMLFMHIPYWEVSAFLITFLYSKYTMPERVW